MIQRKTVVFLVMCSWVIVSLFYSENFGIVNSMMDEPVLYATEYNNVNEDDDYLINTPGCYIPNYSKTLKFLEANDINATCGLRAIFIDKDGSNITFRINRTLMREHYDGSQEYRCCYKFAVQSTIAGRETTSIMYTKCRYFDNGSTIELKEEIIVVACTTLPNKKFKSRFKFYKDAYIIVKKLKQEKTNSAEGNKTWNVLILGLDTMSRARFLSSMPKTAIYLKQHGWLDYRAYQKVAYNTFPNVMAFLTGLNTSIVDNVCKKSMDKCRDLIIWSKLQTFGYVTAYGEDYLMLPDTFSRPGGFKTSPTNHYMRPFFLIGETLNGNLLCTRQLPSAIHTLNYALDFVDSYKNEKFFAMFWLNSYSHNCYNLPTLLDKDLTIFFDNLNNTDALSNTFVFFISDHGIRHGTIRLSVESYYEERLPMFFMWAPPEFQESNAQAYYNLKLNQNRLTTPYDFHVTLLNILQLSNDFITGGESKACPECTSLFVEKTKYRNCTSAGVTKKWCSCHNLTKANNKEYGVARSIELAVSYIQNKTKSIFTTKCMKCSLLQLKTVLRTHMHVDNDNNTNYVIVFDMSPGDVAFEVSVIKDEKDFQIMQPIRTITTYNNRESCVIHREDREYCVCEKQSKCKN